MATFTASLTYTCTIDIEIPDSKVTSLLENDFTNVSDYAELKFDGMPASINIEVSEVDIVIEDVGYIAKDNGNEYEWDGEKLVKL
jgi:hypothetical protein